MSHASKFENLTMLKEGTALDTLLEEARRNDALKDSVECIDDHRMYTQIASDYNTTLER